MRSRYTAYVRRDVDHVFRSWHPRTRPADLDRLPETDWRGLKIIDVVDGGVEDAEGIVEFRAFHATGSQHERSRFTRRAGRWVYLDANRLEPADALAAAGLLVEVLVLE